jgi:hypothetical protein
MALSIVAQGLAKLSETELKKKLAELAAIMPDTAKDVERELAENAERISKERAANEKRNKRQLDDAAFQPLVPSLGKVKLDGLKVSVDVTALVINSDGSIGDITVKLTGDSLTTVQDGVKSRIGAVLVGKAPGRTLKVQSVAGAWTLTEEPTKTASKSSGGSTGGSRGDRFMILDGQKYETGSAAAKFLGVDVGGDSGWRAVLNAKNGETLKSHGAKFYCKDRNGIEKLLVAQVAAGNVTLVDVDGNDVQ